MYQRRTSLYGCFRFGTGTSPYRLHAPGVRIERGAIRRYRRRAAHGGKVIAVHCYAGSSCLTPLDLVYLQRHSAYQEPLYASHAGVEDYSSLPQ